MRPLLAVVVAVLVTTGSVADVTAGAGVQGLRVLSADPGGVTLEYRLPEYRIRPYETPGGTFTQIVVPGLGALADEGKPQLPAGGTWVAVPATGSYRLTILEQETETLPEVDVLPVYRHLFIDDGSPYERPAREFYLDSEAYASAALYPAAPATLEGEGWLRFQRVSNLRLYPVRYRAAERTLLITTRLVVRIDFPEGSRLRPQALESQGLGSGPYDDRYFESIYRGAVINYDQGRGWRAKRSRRPGVSPLGEGRQPLRPQAIGTGNPEWKVQIDSTGLWRVDFTQLAARGFPSGIVTDAVVAFRRDTTVDLQPEPWVMTEIPIDLIDANANSQFDSGDFLLLPVRSWADRVSAGIYERRHGDYEMVWLSYKSAGSGLRVRTEPGWLDAVTPSRPGNFQSRVRFERNFFYLQFPANVTLVDQFHWVDGFSDDISNPVDTLFADLMDLDVNGADISITAQWVGNTRTLHFVSANWVSPSGETQVFVDESISSQSVKTVTGTIPAAAASPDGNNRLRIWGVSNQPGALGSGAPFNWFEVTYPRFYRARNNRLEFNSGGAADTVEFAIDGFTAGGLAPPVYAYDVTDRSDPVRLAVDPAQVEDQGGSWRVRLQRVVAPATTSDFIVATDPKRIPDSAITGESPSSLYLTGTGNADFIIIAHEPFADACRRLADYRRSQGISTLLVRDQDLYDEFNGGRKSHFAIRRFLRYALENWNTRFVLLVGDASEDARGFRATSGIDYLPTPIIQGPIPVSVGFEAVPSDNWYVQRLTGSTGGFDDLLLDMVIGRWTASSPSQVSALVDKSIAYDTPPLDEPWRNRAVLIADDNFSDVSTFGGSGGGFEYCERNEEVRFQTINENVEKLIKEEGGFRDFDVRPFYLTDQLASFPKEPGQSCPVSRDKGGVLDYVDLNVSPSLFVLLSEGAAFVNFQGHGNPVLMTHEQLYMSFGVAQDIDFIFNDGKPWVFSGFACHLNAYAGIEEGGFFGDGLAERMVNEPVKGAIASYASTAFELLPSSTTSHLNLHFHRAFFVDPPYERFAGEVGARVLLGEASALGTARMVANTFGLERSAALTYVFLGDPLAAMNFGAPRLWARAADADTLRTGVPYFPTAPEDTVEVEFEVLDESFLETLTITQQGEGAAGAVPPELLAFTPEFPDTTSGKRYQVTYRAEPRPASYDIIVTAADRAGLTGQFVLRFELEAALTLRGQTLRDGDNAVAGVEYVWQVRSPARLTETDFAVLVNGDPVAHVAAPVESDTTGRLWKVAFTPEIADGANLMQIDVALDRGGASRNVRLNVTPGLDFQNVYAFPNPFREFTTVNFNVSSSRPTDVQLRIFTVTGRLVYERLERSLVPGYYQWMWDGRDSGGAAVGFGTYIYRLAAVNDQDTESSVQSSIVRAPLAPPGIEPGAAGGQ